MIARRLSVLALIACALAFALYELRSRAREHVAEVLFPGLEARAVARVSIGARGASAITLERASSADRGSSSSPGPSSSPGSSPNSGAVASFTLRERHGFEATALDLDAWLARVASLRGGARAGSDPRSAALGLGDDALEIVLYAADGARLASLWQGRVDGDASFLAPQSGSSGAGGVWRVPHWQRVSAQPLAWIDTRVPLPPSKEWTKLRIELGASDGRDERVVECVLAASSAGATGANVAAASAGTSTSTGTAAASGPSARWTCAGRDVPTAAFTRVAQIADALYFGDVLAADTVPEHGFAAPLLALRVETAADARACEVAIGAPLGADGAQRALRCSSWPRPFVVSIGAPSVALLVDALRALEQAADAAAPRAESSPAVGGPPSKH